MNSTTIAGWANGENNPHTHTQARRVVDRAFVLRTTTDGCVCSSTTTSSPSKVKDEKEEEELLPTSSPAESWKHSEQSKWSAANQASSGSAPNKKAKWVEWWVDGWLAIFGFSFFFFCCFFFSFFGSSSSGPKHLNVQLARAQSKFPQRINQTCGTSPKRKEVGRRGR